MFIYNVTTKLNPGIEVEWLEWMKDIHIPEVMQTGCFTESRVLRLLESDDSDGFTYTVQFMAETKAAYDRYIDVHAASLRERTLRKWNNKIIAFRSLMELIH
ncbi:MAG: DUF4286 family protein [Chitinophagaceae bacterium]